MPGLSVAVVLPVCCRWHFDKVMLRTLPLTDDIYVTEVALNRGARS